MKKITWKEAMEIAKQILEDAEKERLEFALEEAKRGIQYDEYVQ